MRASCGGRVLASIALLALAGTPVAGQSRAKPRARDLGLPIGGTAGALDAITDVAGVEVGHTTLISGSGRLVVGQGPVRTGVTVVHPRGKNNPDPVFGAPQRRRCNDPPASAAPRDDAAGDLGSIIVIVATDAPLLPHELKRVATRVSLGVGRMGGYGGNGSGDIFIAFSTANPGAAARTDSATVTMLSNATISPLFNATVQATEEAIVNALLAAETTTGANDLRVHALPVDRLMAAMRKYGRVK